MSTKSQAVAPLTIMLLAGAGACFAQDCSIPLPADQTFPPLTTGGGLVVYRTGFEVDLDGAPNAYHIDGTNDPQTGGLEHICSGADIEVLDAGRLGNKYPSFSVPGSSERCRQDYLRLRDAGFPACGSGMCARFYGVVTTGDRSCGFPPHSDDTGCSVPPRQKSPAGTELPFYVSQTSLMRHGAARTDQTAYLDARFVPYLVYDARELSTSGVHLGDVALVTWRAPDDHTRAVFAVFGDGGTHLSEASAALLNRLHGKADSDVPDWRHLGVSGGATVVAFPNTRGSLGADFPAASGAAAKVVAAGRRVLNAAGPDALACSGLTDEAPIAKE